MIRHTKHHKILPLSSLHSFSPEAKVEITQYTYLASMFGGVVIKGILVEPATVTVGQIC